jgi:uncharacterized protein (TIGR00725 family)
MMNHQKTIAIIGARACNDQISQIAERMGALLAKNGYTIICGGLGGVMEAACKGAEANGGTTIGILPGNDPKDANPFVKIAIATGLGISRNLIIIRSAEAVVAISGGFGTLSEMAFALQLQKPVVGIGTWDVSDQIEKASDPEDAMRKLAKVLNEGT